LSYATLLYQDINSKSGFQNGKAGSFCPNQLKTLSFFTLCNLV